MVQFVLHAKVMISVFHQIVITSEHKIQIKFKNSLNYDKKVRK